jgi:hypothetical protein
LLNPDRAPIPEAPEVLYALCAALVARVGAGNAGRLLQYAMRLPAEYSVLLVRDASRQCDEVQAASEFARWASKFGDVLT